MKPVASISVIASLLADPKRSAMLWALIDGLARPSDELARITGLTPSSTCAHLGRLLAGGLLKIEARGRKRYFRLAAPEVGAAVEALASVPVREHFRQGVRVSREATGIPLAMRRARLCRDHLGGELAADLYQRLQEAKWLEVCDRQLEVSPIGRLHFADFGIFVEALALREGRSCSLCSCCSEWSEQRPHLGGALGSSLLKLFVQSGWVRLNDGSRALHITPAGLREIPLIAQPAMPLAVGE